MSTNNKAFKVMLLKHYLKPLSSLSENESGFRNEIQQEVAQFMEANKDVELQEYLERARNKFGHWVAIANQSTMFDRIISIEAKMKYFFVLSIISIVLGIIIGLMQIK